MGDMVAMRKMTSDEVTRSRKAARKAFDGRQALFDACWREYRRELSGGCDMPYTTGDIDEALERIAGEKVNNPRSMFYMYG